MSKKRGKEFVQIVTHDLVNKSREQQYLHWFRQTLLPTRLGVSGCVSCQHYTLVLGDLPSHLVVYEYLQPEESDASPGDAWRYLCDDAEWPEAAPVFKQGMSRTFAARSHHRADSASGSSIAGGGMLMVMADIDAGFEAEFDEWYEQEHIPERMALKGAVAARRFVALQDEPKFLALWEVTSLDDFTKPDYRFKLPAPPSPWTLRMRRLMSQSRGVYDLLGDYRL